MDLETTNITIDVIINEAVLNKLAKTIDKMLKDVCSRLKNVPEDEREFSKDTIFIRYLKTLRVSITWGIH